eukprot:scaffold68607_cov27-Tisochrysis_lutea.AAC.1
MSQAAHSDHMVLTPLSMADVEAVLHPTSSLNHELDAPAAVVSIASSSGNAASGLSNELSNIYRHDQELQMLRVLAVSALAALPEAEKASLHILQLCNALLFLNSFCRRAEILMCNDVTSSNLRDVTEIAARARIEYAAAFLRACAERVDRGQEFSASETFAFTLMNWGVEESEDSEGSESSM